MTRLKTDFEKAYPRYVSLLLLVAGVVVYLGRLIWLAWTQIPSFDGSMNLQVSVSLLETGKYATIYNGGTVFDGRIQTGAPVLFLIAAVFRIFGTGSFQALMVNVFYIMLMVFFLAKISKKIHAGEEAMLFFIALTVMTLHYFELAMGIYGEIPTLALFVGTVCFLMLAEDVHKDNYFFVSGILFSLACLTKTVILIAVPALAIVFLSKWLLEKRAGIKSLVLWTVGALVPILVFEIYKFYQLGADAYVSFWTSQSNNILKQAGVKTGYTDTPNLFEKLMIHMQAFSDYFSVAVWIIWLVLILNFVWFAVKVAKKRKLEYVDVLELVAYFYFGWWLLITPTEKAWGRRILIGLILLEWLTSVKVFWMIQKIKLSAWKKYALNGALACLAVVYIAVGKHQQDEVDKTACLELAAVVQEKAEEENALICGSGWWQAAAISFYSGIPFYDLEQLDMSKVTVPVYFVADMDWVRNSGMRLEDLPYSVEEVFQTYKRGMKLYRVTGRIEFKVEEKQSVAARVFPALDEADMVRNVYPYDPEAGGSWVQQNAAVLLAREEEDTVYEISLLIPLEAEEAPYVEIYIDDTLVYRNDRMTDKGFVCQVEVPEQYREQDYLEFLFKTNIKVQAEGDGRNLAMVLRKIEPVRQGG